MPASPGRRRLPPSYFAAGVALLLAASSLAGGAHALFSREAREVRERAAAALTDRAGAAARRIDEWIEHRRRELEFTGRDPLLTRAILAQLTAPSESDAHVLEEALEMLRQRRDFERVQLYTADRQPFASSGGNIALDDRFDAWFRGASVTGRIVSSGLYVPRGADSDGPVLDFIVAIGDPRPQAQGPLALLIARADPNPFFGSLLASSNVGATARFGLVVPGAHGDTLFEPRPTDGFRARLVDAALSADGPFAAAIATGRVVETPQEADAVALATSQPVAATGWHVVGAVDRDALYAPLHQVLRFTLMIGLAALVACGGVTLLWWRRELRSATKLAAAWRRETLLKEHFAVAGRFVNDIVLLLEERTARIVEANDRALDAYGYSREELLSMTAFQLRPSGANEANEVGQQLAAVRRNGDGRFLTRHRRKDGSTFPIDISARLHAIGNRRFVQTIARDVSERVEHERRLEALSAERDRVLARLQLQFDRMLSACIVIDAGGIVTQINPAFERTFGRRVADVVGRSFRDCIAHDDFRELAASQFERLLKTPGAQYVGVHDNRTLQGRPLVCRWSFSSLQSADSTVHGVIAMADDITEQTTAERALRTSEERYRQLSEVSPVGIVRTDARGRAIFVNQRACTIAGLHPSEALGADLSRVIHADDAARVESAWRAYVGSLGAVPFAPEFRMLHRDGQVRWVLLQAAPEYDADGRLAGHVSTITDITLLKHAQSALQQAHDHLEERVAARTHELELAKNAAERSDRVKTAFLSTMSHELRTPLNSILGFTDVILQGLSGPVSDLQRRQLGIVRDSAGHLRALIEDVLDISRIEAGQVSLERADVDLRELVARRLAAFGAEASRKGLALHLQQDDAIPMVRSDRKRIAQVLDNLLSNALKFTDAGAITVELRLAGPRIELVVGDTGIGIPPEALERLFNPFTQVIRPGGRLHEGTGLRLAISRDLARALGGDVSVCSELGGGSRFTFCLPVAADVATTETPGDAPSPPGRVTHLVEA